jgi:hypothetical protein
MAWRWRRGRPELDPVNSRQGYLDRPVLVVLVASSALVVVAFGILLFAI